MVMDSASENRELRMSSPLMGLVRGSPQPLAASALPVEVSQSGVTPTSPIGVAQSVRAER